MRKLLIVLTLLIILLSFAASLAGVFSYGHEEYQSFTTVRGEVVEVARAGTYRYSLRTLVSGGTPWDLVWLVLGIPIFLAAFVLYLRGSLRGAVLFAGSLAAFLYKYALWTFDWAFSSWYLVYVALFSLSLWSLVLVLSTIDGEQLRAAITQRFPAKALARFCFAVAGLLFLKCLGETVPTLGTGAMPAGATGYYTLVDQALDLGVLSPFCVVAGILLLRRHALGYTLCPSSLVLVLSIGLSVTTGEIMVGLSNGTTNYPGIAIFSLFIAVAAVLLVRALASIETGKLPGEQEMGPSHAHSTG